MAAEKTREICPVSKRQKCLPLSLFLVVGESVGWWWAFGYALGLLGGKQQMRANQCGIVASIDIKWLDLPINPVPNPHALQPLQEIVWAAPVLFQYGRMCEFQGDRDA